MIKLKVSYEHSDELQQLLARLGPAVKRWKVARQQGRFMRAYVELNSGRTTGEQRGEQ